MRGSSGVGPNHGYALCAGCFEMNDHCQCNARDETKTYPRPRYLAIGRCYICCHWHRLYECGGHWLCRGCA